MLLPVQMRSFIALQINFQLPCPIFPLRRRTQLFPLFLGEFFPSPRTKNKMNKKGKVGRPVLGFLRSLYFCFNQGMKLTTYISPHDENHKKALLRNVKRSIPRRFPVDFIEGGRKQSKTLWHEVWNKRDDVLSGLVGENRFFNQGGISNFANDCLTSTFPSQQKKWR